MGFRPGPWGWGSPGTALERAQTGCPFLCIPNLGSCLPLCPCDPPALWSWTFSGLMASSMAREELGHATCLCLLSHNLTDLPCARVTWHLKHLPNFYFLFNLFSCIIGKHLLFLLSIWYNLEEEWKAFVLETQTEAPRSDQTILTESMKINSS